MPSPENRTDQLRAHAILAAFAQALTAARRFEGATAPNPPVGCALLDAAGDVVAVGAHERAGAAHAEAAAIADASANGRLADIHTVVVTLEPCNHTGRTPPCAQAILDTPAQAVWIGAHDPNPKVVGGGAARLATAGLDVHMISEIGTPQALALAEDAVRLIAPFAKHQLTGLPFVTVKQAINIGGTMLPTQGQKTFTSHTSLDLAHRLRRRAGAVLTGSGTILADDPEFTVRRVPDFEHAQRKLVIMDRRKRVPDRYVTAARQREFEVWVEADLNAALAKLGAHGVFEVLVEAGPELTQTVLEASLWDEHVRIMQGTANVPDDVSVRRNAADWGR